MENQTLTTFDEPPSDDMRRFHCPDTKWKLSKEEYLKTLDLQKEIFGRYSQMTKPGGRLVYSTCSILPSENDKQVDHFLSEHPDFKLLSKKTYLPNVEGFDGFFVSTFERSKT